MHAQQLVFADV